MRESIESYPVNGSVHKCFQESIQGSSKSNYPKTLRQGEKSNGQFTRRKPTKEKWQPVLELCRHAPIKDDYRKNITAIMLENQEKALKEETQPLRALINGFGDTNGAFNTVAGFDPVLISLVRRAMPNLIAYDVCGVQPMSGPTGLIFAMKAKFGQTTGRR